MNSRQVAAIAVQAHVLLSSVAVADDTPSEIASLADRQAWAEIDALGIGPDAMSDADLAIAVRAALEVGDAQAWRDRLDVLQRRAPTVQVQSELHRAWTEYGSARAIAVAGGFGLITAKGDLTDEGRRALAFANQQIGAHGEFVGLLPIGTYELPDGTSLTVTAWQSEPQTRPPYVPRDRLAPTCGPCCHGHCGPNGEPDDRP